MHSPKQIALVLFGGSGERFGSKEPKQFVILKGKPMMAETLLGLSQCEDVDEIYIVSKADTIEKTKEVLDRYGIRKVKAILPGGETRQKSVEHGIDYLDSIGIPEDSLLLIQDGDRPNISPEIVKANFLEAKHHGAAVTAIPASDSILYSELGYEVDKYLPRKMVYLAQTPQTFVFSLIRLAHRKAKRSKVLQAYTDDASLVQALGHIVRIVPGEKENVKITTKLDVATYLEGRRSL